MNGNPSLTRMVKQTLYDLKQRFGAVVTVYKVLDANTNFMTGEKTLQTESRRVRRCAVLPSTTTREVYQGVNYLSASKVFTSLGGMGWDQSVRGFIFEGSDLPNYTWDYQDWIVYRDERYDVAEFEELEFNAGWLVIGKHVKGDKSGGSPSVDISDPMDLTDNEDANVEPGP